MGSSPKAPKPTAEEKLMRRRQAEELTRLDEEENRRVKSMTRMRLGARSLLGSKPAETATPSGGAGSGVAARVVAGMAANLAGRRVP